MALDLASSSGFGLDRLTTLFNRAFAGYLVDVDLTVAALGDLLRVDGVDLAVSRIVRDGKREIGIAFIARRGWTSRIAAMGIVPEARGRGVGTWLMKRLVGEAHDRGDRRLVLEVIEQNTPAVRLYRGCGLRVKRRLVGYVGTGIDRGGDRTLPPLEEVDPHEVAELVVPWGAKDLPWQLSAHSLLGCAPPARAFRAGPARVILSDPDREQVTILALLVAPVERRRGHATRLVRALANRYPDRVWGVRVALPEDLCPGLFESLAFVRGDLTQFEMVLDLTGAVVP